MSIPLDRLYNYLDNLIDDDILIYRFFPHGSKNPEDLDMLHSRIDLSGNWRGVMTTPQIIFYDQEPLDHMLYANEEKMLDIFLKRFPDSAISMKSEWVRHHTFKTNIRAFAGAITCFESSMLCHSEKNSTEVEWYDQHNFVCVYWWSHAIIARDWFRYAQWDPALKINFDNIVHDFLIYNRAWEGTREYRLKFSELIADAELIPHCQIKFSAYDGDNYYLNHQFKNNTLSLTRNDLHLIYSKNTHLSSSSADYNNVDYSQSGIEVVLETLFDDTRQHLTEKTLRPIACGRPFILATTPGSLQYLRDYGFKTFNGLINEDYDTILDPLDRLRFIVSEMRRISNLDSIAKKQLWTELYKIADYNRQLFFSDNWQQQIVNEFKNNIKVGIEKVYKTFTATTLKASYEQIKIDPYLVEFNQDLSMRSLKDVDDVIAQAKGKKP